MPGRRVKFGPLIAVLCVAELVCCLETNMISLALSKLYGIYHDPVRVGWIVTAFTLTAASCAVIGARIGDIYGRRNVLVGMLMIACTGSVISFSSQDFNIIILGRILQGVSMGVLPLCYGLLRELVPADKIPTGVGLLSGVYVGGIAVAMLAGGLVLDHGPWQGVFLVSAGCAVLAIILILLVVPPTAAISKSRRIDYWGAILLMPGIALPMLGFERLGKTGWATPEPWAFLVAGIGLLVLWVRHERTHPDPLVDLSQFRSRPIVAAYLAMMASYTGPALFAIIILPMLTQPAWTVVGLGLTATAAGMLKIPANIFSAFAGTFNGYLTRRFGAPRVAAGAAVPIILTCVGLFFRHDSVWLIGFAMIVGFASPLVVLWAALTTTIITLSPPEKAAEAAGVLQVAKSLGYSVGAQTIAMLLSTSAVSQAGVRFPSEQAYVLAFGFCGFLALVSMLLALSAGRSKANARETAVV